MITWQLHMVPGFDIFVSSLQVVIPGLRTADHLLWIGITPPERIFKNRIKVLTLGNITLLYVCQ